MRPFLVVVLLRLHVLLGPRREKTVAQVHDHLSVVVAPHAPAPKATGLEHPLLVGPAHQRVGGLTFQARLLSPK